MNKLFCITLQDALYDAFIADDRWSSYLKGMANTLVISLLAVVIGIIIGLLIAVIKNIHTNTGKLAILSKIGDFYVTIIRGIPVTVLIIFMYFGVLVFLKRIPYGSILIAAITFGLNSGAYVSEIFRGGINSVDKGQMEASRSLGIGYGKTMFKVIIPQALKNSIPPLGNEFIALIKETSIVSLVGIVDLTFAANNIANILYDFFTPLIIAGLFYLIIVIALTKLMKYVERRLSKSDKR
ncbi:MAG: amino acid ABC transporter permease [Clostridia bacterium]|nr:amino acid ABC transporter permease [Clostridia bacterium]